MRRQLRTLANESIIIAFARFCWLAIRRAVAKTGIWFQDRPHFAFLQRHNLTSSFRQRSCNGGLRLPTLLSIAQYLLAAASVLLSNRRLHSG
jgi:hypothetical protein